MFYEIRNGRTSLDIHVLCLIWYFMVGDDNNPGYFLMFSEKCYNTVVMIVRATDQND